MSGYAFIGYEEQWSELREKRSPKTLDCWTVSRSRATSEDRDGDYGEDQSICTALAYGDTDQVQENDDQALQGMIVDGRHPGEENYWVAALSPLLPGGDFSPDEVLSQLPRALTKAYSE